MRCGCEIDERDNGVESCLHGFEDAFGFAEARHPCFLNSFEVNVRHQPCCAGQESGHRCGLQIGAMVGLVGQTHWGPMQGERRGERCFPTQPSITTPSTSP